MPKYQGRDAPKWAVELLELKDRVNSDLMKEIAEVRKRNDGEGVGNIRVGRMSELRPVGGPRDVVVFDGMNPRIHKDDKAEISIRRVHVERTNRVYLEVMSHGEGMSITPSASNVVRVEMVGLFDMHIPEKRVVEPLKIKKGMTSK